MKIRQWARMLLAVAPVLAGCKGFWDLPSGSGSGGTGTASGVFYVLNQKTSEIAGFSFAASSTSLTAVTNSPYALGAVVPFSLAMSPNGGFLYVSSAAGIFVYSVNGSTGGLTLLNTGQAISADPAFTMAVDPSGGWLVEGVSGLSQVNAIPLDATTGLILSGATEQHVNLPATATAVQQVTTTRSGATNPYVFVAMGTQGTAIIPFNSSSSGNPFGTVKTISVKNGGGGDLELAVDLSRPVLYVGETAAMSGSSNPGGLRMFNIGANATLTEVSGSPYATGGVGPSAILPTTNYVYVSNKTVTGSNNGNITAFAITTVGTTYSLTAVTSGTISAGVGTIGLAEDSSGTYVLAVSFGGSPDLSAFTISTTGALTAYATGATGSDPVNAVSIVAVP